MSGVSNEFVVPGKAGPNLVFIGPPGAGKGTLAKSLGSLNLEHVSSGDFFRAEVARKSEFGARISASLREGEFVSDELTLSIMRKWYFSRKTDKGFLLDGFPRNLLQAAVLGEWMDSRRETLTRCLYLNLAPADSILRISQRRVCPNDGSVYHLTFQPPIRPDHCDRCGAPLVQRSDDTEETVSHRLRLFEVNTLPLVDYYRQMGILSTFDASVSQEQLKKGVLTQIPGLN